MAERTTGDFEAEIFDTDPSASLVRRLVEVLDSAPYTTTFLNALAEAIEENHGDDDGAELVRAFAKKYASHEAETT